MAFQQFYWPLRRTCSCDDKRASLPLSMLAVVVHRHESHFYYIRNIQTPRCHICSKTPSGARLTAAEAGGSLLIRAVMDVPKRKEAAGTPHLENILFVGGKAEREQRSVEGRRKKKECRGEMRRVG